MSNRVTKKDRGFEGMRLEVTTSGRFDVVLDRLRNSMGRTSIPEIVELAQKPISEVEYRRVIQERFVGKSGFMLFHEIDHGGWLSKFGIRRRIVRWIFGNPLFAITMRSRRIRSNPDHDWATASGRAASAAHGRRPN